MNSYVIIYAIDQTIKNNWGQLNQFLIITSHTEYKRSLTEEYFVKGLSQATTLPNSTAIEPTPLLQEYRCDCGKLLFKGLLVKGIVEVKCKRCQDIKRVSL
ncbi:MAG TPA: hypothetical protein VK694_04310 [Verrucomicrobiae bacterium]|nr:hypothetical protein [Verrucomicrobiae bacterium]